MINTPTTATVIDTPEAIAAYRLLAIRSALKLEAIGMKGRVSVAKMAREVLTAAKKKASRDKKVLLEEYTAHLKEIGVLVPRPAS